MLRIQQFAQLAHVTVRTLHHYDRLGLLSPALRSARGYRLYRMEDLIVLERIRVLRYLGLSLREIADLMSRGEPAAQHTLGRQAKVLRERRDGIDRILRVIERAQQGLNSAAVTDWSLYQNILKEIEMQESQSWAMKYYSPDAQESIEHQRKQWSPELQEKVTADWQHMFADVQSAIDRHVEPRSFEGKALAARWMELVHGFTGGNAEVLQGLNRLYADRPNWPVEKTSNLQNDLPKPELMAFIREAQADH